MKKFYLLFLVFCSLMALNLNAQDNFEMGYIAPSDLNLDYYLEKYPDASAVIISYITDYKFTNRPNSNLIFSTTVKKRLMILRESGLSYADISIPYFNNQGSGESITSFRANIYNLNGNRVQRHRVRMFEGFKRSAGSNWYELVFALPGVKVGSVIEYSYEKISDFVMEPRHWMFQKDIPVIYARLNFKEPDFLKHQFERTGVIDPDLTRIELIPSRYVIQIPVQVRPGVFSLYSQRIHENSMKKSFVARNIPASREEPYGDHPINYREGLLFLASDEETAEWDWSKEDTLAIWTRINKNILSYPNFKGYFEKALEAVSPWLADTVGIAQDSLIHWALSTVHNRVSWNGISTYRAGAYPEDVLELGYGNIAEVNLMLLALLRKMGFQAFPVLLSTSDNGRVRYTMPGTRQWNYVIVRLTDRTLPGGEILLDASPHIPLPGFLPDRAINGRGLQIDEATTQWISLEQNVTIKEKRHFDLNLNPNGDLSGTMEIFVDQFGKFSWINLLSVFGEQTYWEVMENETGLQFTNRSINLHAENAEPLHVKADIFIPAFAQKAGNEVILPSLLIKTLEENHFKTHERLSPVVFNYLLDSEVSMSLKYPKDHSLSYIPDNVSDTWKGFSYAYQWSQQENQVEVFINTQRNFRRIEAEQYGEFREFVLRRLFNHTDSIVFEASETESTDALTDDLPAQEKN